jgi:tryptophan halogenase
MIINNICILGAGTSGLISALILKKSYPNINITVIKSPIVDIVGVGEGSTEHWAEFMNFVDIDVVELIKETDATFKYGIKFDNWNGDNKEYFHAVVTEFTQQTALGYPYIYHKLLVDNEDPLKCVGDFIINSEHYYPLELSANQFHFDTFKLNEFLQRKCLEANIEIVEDTIISVDTNDNGIASISGEVNNYVADFFIDCSGFHKVLTTKLNSEWVDCADYLPVNSAITFPTEFIDNQKIPSYTKATALSAGWVWQIPTQNRFGNGYVYCDKFIDEETALKEVEELYGKKLNIVKRFKFSAGYTKTPWIKNVCAIGLSASFIEPLEATNIGTAIQQAFSLSTCIPTWDPSITTIADIYNSQFVDVFQNTIDFVQLHYLTKREDTDFWKYCKTLKLTEFNKKTLPMYKENMPLSTTFAKPYILFRNHNWFLVLNGLGHFDREKLIAKWKNMPLEMQHNAAIKLFVIKTKDDAEQPLAHRDALNEIMNRKTL